MEDLKLNHRLQPNTTDSRSLLGELEVRSYSNRQQYRIVSALDDFQEQCRSVLHVLRKQLQQVTSVVKVDQNPQLLKLLAAHR